ncbi:autotransporter assembly complex protein TamA [Azospirillum rugosum]|uniref:Translocation and assembly module subunit TamA n=1 Tax=Azospirillum rugosum TaxID=416170 RepID=A0ABS4SLK5_9PROT|nr:autotransporter assembly complex family protein [Azospirillum rugosum]MBP2293436.1 translocation and assembly module TamA [Azospirillum rugosum]MDQ0530207.1 translocation and assembly module TamA [Azospirillum rugosum]
MIRRASASRLAILLLTGALASQAGPDARAQEPTPPPAGETPAETPAEPSSAQPEAGPKVPYEVEITGVEDGGLNKILNDTSTLVGLRDDPPPSVLGLERRAADDRERLHTALRSEGYYDATLDIRVDADRQPAKVTVAVQPGPAYRFKTITIASADAAPLPGAPITAEDIGLTPGDRARAPLVVDGQSALLRRLSDRGHPFATVAERRVVVNHEERSMDVTYTVAPGQLVVFGDTRIEGLKDVDEDLILGRLPWARGQVYDTALLDKARTQIAGLGVFDTVSVRLADQPGPGGSTPVTVTLAERKFRFIGANVFYSSTDGVGGGAYWGHRNLFGGAEQLRLGVDIGRIAGDNGSGSARGRDLDLPDLRFSASFRKPDFLATQQSLIANFQVASEQLPAYDRVATLLSAGLERQWTDQLKSSISVSGERGRVRSNLQEFQTAFVGVPVGIAWDGSNNLLNPTEGYRVSFQGTPWFPIGGDTDTQFTTLQVNASAYHDLTGDGRYVAAGRIGLGGTAGASLAQIPPDHRFYAGGGGSVRGFGFQKAGPRDVFGDPTGGRSLFEAGLEMRIKVTDTIGVVPFVDAGTVYDSAFPDFSQQLRVGAGIGARYYTDFGPLRVDVGFPVNAESGDAKWQLYISLGQAF